MELSLRHRHWSVLQVVAIVVCYRGKALSDREQDCVGSQLNLRCPEMKVIEVTEVVLGDSICHWGFCCITDSDCTRDANAFHVMDVHHRCNGQSSCTVDVIRDEIDCGNFGSKSNNDFERITYNCSDYPRRSTIATPCRPCSTEDNLRTEKNQQEKETENGDTTSSGNVDENEGSSQNGSEQDAFGPHKEPKDNNWYTSGIVIVCVVCLIVIIAVVASVSVVTVRRKRRRQAKSSNAIKKSELETERKEAIYINDAAGTSLPENAGSSVPIYINSGARNFETPTSDYCKLEGVASERIQCDSQYEQLDHGRNYEPLIVYEQLK